MSQYERRLDLLLNENTKRLIYSLLRCPPALTNLLKTLYSQNKPEHSGPTHWILVIVDASPQHGQSRGRLFRAWQPAGHRQRHLERDPGLSTLKSHVIVSDCYWRRGVAVGRAGMPWLWQEGVQECPCQAKGWLLEYANSILICQKMAIRDQQAMVELLQISCLMIYLAPKLEAHLGKGEVLEEVAKLWTLGRLVLGQTMQRECKESSKTGDF